ncbi:MAG: hypothetical protein VX624_00090 [Pseudomonadota bacterium]|nr:hypothetical protein [Pseudomonadota bacterium]
MFAEEFQIRREAEEIDLHAVTSGVFQLNKLIDGLLRRPKDIYVVANNTLIAMVTAPGRLVAALLRAHQSVDGPGIFRFKGCAAKVGNFFLGLSADHVWGDDGLDSASLRLRPRLDSRRLRRQPL